MVNVRWERYSEEEATWELESEMYEKYPHLFWCIIMVMLVFQISGMKFP